MVIAPGWSRRRALMAGLVSLLALSLLAVACGGDDGALGLGVGEPRSSAAAPIIVPAGRPLVIGVSVPLTGPDATLGAEDRDAVIVALERWKAENGSQVQGHDIELQVEDDGCTEADITVQAARRLLRREGLVGVIGPDCSAGAEAAIPVYASAGIVAISGSATKSDLTTRQPEGRFFFRTAYRNDLEGTMAGLFTATDLGARTVYMVDDGEPYGLDLADSSQQVMEALGVVVTRESVQRGAVDFSDLAARIAADDPDLVGFAGFNPEAALLYRQLRDAGYDGIFGAGDAAAGPLFIEPVGAEAAEGVIFAGCSLALPEDFVTEFQALHGHPPEASPFAASYADAATILLDAVARAAVAMTDGSLTIDPIALRDAVRATALTDGVSGSVAFDANGDRVPPGVDDLSDFVASAIEAGDIELFPALGLVPCQVQGGKLVNLLGPGAQERR